MIHNNEGKWIDTQPYIQVRRGQVAVVKKDESGRVQRANNWEELEQLATQSIKRFIDKGENLEGAEYPLSPKLLHMAKFGEQVQEDVEWIPLAEAKKLSNASISGITHAIERGLVDARIENNGPRARILVNKAQVIDNWAEDNINTNGNRMRWLGKQAGLSNDEIDRMRFWSKVDTDENTGCWLWIGGRSGRGYGIFWLKGKPEAVHRVSYNITRGQLDSKVFVKHTCKNSMCVNPEHLYVSMKNR